MLLVTVFRDSTGSIAAVELQGHTEHAPRGEDIVCAGASAVVQTALLGCTKLLNIHPGLEQEGGYLYFTLPADLDPDLDEKAQIILATMLLGLQELQAQYPEHLSILTKHM